MAETERPDNRPKCDWPITETHADGGTSTRKCGSEDRIFKVKGVGLTERDICQRHLNDAWKDRSVDSADPICG